jgi:hypothetical protein
VKPDAESSTWLKVELRSKRIPVNEDGDWRVLKPNESWKADPRYPEDSFILLVERVAANAQQQQKERV